MGCEVCISQIANSPIFCFFLCCKRKVLYVLFSLLHFKLRKINASSIDSCRCSSLKSIQPQAQSFKAVRQPFCITKSIWPTVFYIISNNNITFKIYSCCKYHRFCFVLFSNCCRDNLVISFFCHICDFCLS